jgi:hypothetical protein
MRKKQQHKIMRNIIIRTVSVCATACLFTFVSGCQTHDRGSAQPPTQPAPVAAIPPATSSVASAPKPAMSVVRVKAGLSAPFTDSSGNVWQPDQGFDGGDVVDRDPGMTIANTKDPGLFRSEHYGMSSFSCSVPNGKYMAKLYFAETFEGITGTGQRVFSFNVQGHEFKDFDVWAKAAGANRAYIETVPVEVTNGKFNIVFTSNIENPEINAIEILPQT